MALASGDEQLSYGALAARADRLARQIVRLLGARGLAAETRIGLCLERSLERVVATLAILQAGGAYLPLDPSHPRERLAFQIRDGAAPLILTEERLCGVLPASGGFEVLCLDQLPGAGPDAPLARPALLPPLPIVPAEALAYVMYTSGSTGTPKGVAVTHRSVARLVLGTDYAAFGPDEVWPQLAPYAFDAATLEIWGPLLHGGRLVVAAPGELALDEIGDLFLRHGVTSCFLTSGLFHQLVDHALPALAGLRQLLAGGDVLSPPHVGRAAGLPGLRMIARLRPDREHRVLDLLPGGAGH